MTPLWAAAWPSLAVHINNVLGQTSKDAEREFMPAHEVQLLMGSLSKHIKCFWAGIWTVNLSGLGWRTVIHISSKAGVPWEQTTLKFSDIWVSIPEIIAWNHVMLIDTGNKRKEHLAKILQCWVWLVGLGVFQVFDESPSQLFIKTGPRVSSLRVAVVQILLIPTFL